MSTTIDWEDPPPFIVVGGSEWLRINRFKNDLAESAKSAGMSVAAVDSASDVESLVSPNPLFQTVTDQRYLVIFRGWRAESQLPANFSFQGKHCILYILEGRINKTSCPVLPQVDSSLVVKFNKFSGSYTKSVTHAVEFLESEFSRHGVPDVNPQLLTSMAKTAGTDLGVLSFEVQKAVMASNGGEITVGVLRDTIKPTNHFDFTPLRTSLSQLNPTQFLKFMDRAYSRSVSDPTMIFLRGRGGVGDLAMAWLQTSLLLKQDASPKYVAEVIGAPEWAVKRDHIPSARRWGTVRLLRLVRGVARADSSFVSGCPNPRIALESEVVSAMKDPR